MRVKDWKHKYPNAFEAFKNQALRPNTQQFFNAMIVFVAGFIILVAASMGVLGAGIGFISCQPILYVCCLYLIGSTVVYQSRTFSIKELIMWIVLNVVYFVVGIVYFIVQYEVAEFTFDVTQKSAAQTQASLFVFFYVLFVPTLIHGLMAGMMFADNGVKVFKQKIARAMVIVFLVGILLMIVSAFLFVKWVAGVAFLGAVLLMIYVLTQVYLYFKNDGYMKPRWEIINKTIVVLLVLFAGVFSAFSDDLETYEGVSYSMLVLLAMLWFYSLF